MKYEFDLSVLPRMIDHCIQEKDVPITHKALNQLHHKNRKNKDFWLNVQIGNYHMDNIILDLGFDVNVILRQTWGIMR